MEGTVAQVMSRDVVAVEGGHPLDEVVRVMDEQGLRFLPVVNGRRVSGVITNGDLVRRGVLPLRLELQRSTEAPMRNYSGYELAKEVMTANPVTTTTSMEIGEAGRLLLTHGLKRLPVLGGGDLVGVLSRVDILRSAIVDGTGDVTSRPVRAIARPDAPRVALDAPLALVTETVAGTRLRIAILVDGDDAPQGLVTDAGLLRILGASSYAATARLMDRAGGGAGDDDPVLRRLGVEGAEEPALTVPASAPALEAIALMLSLRAKVMAVVDEGGRLEGVVDRADALRAVVG